MTPDLLFSYMLVAAMGLAAIGLATALFVWVLGSALKDIKKPK